MTEEKITMSRAEFKNAVDAAVLKEQVTTLTSTVEAAEIKQQQYLRDIFEKIRDVQKDIGGWPNRLSQCSSDLEHEMLEHMKRTYMTHKDGQLIRQEFTNSVRSLKLWIVSTVGGFTAAGIVLAWYWKLFGG